MDLILSEQKLLNIISKLYIVIGLYSMEEVLT